MNSHNTRESDRGSRVGHTRDPKPADRSDHDHDRGSRERHSRDHDRDRDLRPAQRNRSRSREDSIVASGSVDADAVHAKSQSNAEINQSQEKDENKLSYAGAAASPKSSQMLQSQSSHENVDKSRSDNNKSHDQHVKNKPYSIMKPTGDIADGKWEKPRYHRKPNRDMKSKSDNKPNKNAKSVDFTLSGIRKETSVDVYVQNIRRKRGESLKDLADKVRIYCQKKGIRVMQARTIANKYYENTVGVKLSIPLRQYDDVIGTRMWPDDVICRKWENKNQGSGTDTSHQSRPRTRNGPTQYDRSRSRDGHRQGRSRSRSRADQRQGRSRSRSRGGQRQGRSRSRSISPLGGRSRSRYRNNQPRYAAATNTYHDKEPKHDSDYWWNNGNEGYTTEEDWEDATWEHSGRRPESEYF